MKRIQLLSVFTDFPGFVAGSRKMGDNHVVTGTAIYTLKDGRIFRIESD